MQIKSYFYLKNLWKVLKNKFNKYKIQIYIGIYKDGHKYIGFNRGRGRGNFLLSFIFSFSLIFSRFLFEFSPPPPLPSMLVNFTLPFRLLSLSFFLLLTCDVLWHRRALFSTTLRTSDIWDRCAPFSPTLRT